MASSEMSSELPEQTLEASTQSFDYAALDIETRTVVQESTTEIKSLMRRTALNKIQIGQKLIDVKQRLGHGEFRKWLKAEFSWGVTTAWKQMKVAQAFKCSQCEHLDIAPSAFYLLTASSTPEQAREEALERARSGEAITPYIASEIVNKYKEPVDVSMASEPMTVDVPAETIEKESNFPTEAEQVQCIEQNQLPIEKEALVSNFVQDNPTGVNQSEQELLGKEIEAELTPSQITNSKQSVTEGKSNDSTKDRRANQIKQENTSITDICKNLTTTIEYLYQEDIVDLIDPLSLKSIVEKLTLLVKKTEASLQKRCDSSYSNN